MLKSRIFQYTSYCETSSQKIPIETMLSPEGADVQISVTEYEKKKTKRMTDLSGRLED